MKNEITDLKFTGVMGTILRIIEGSHNVIVIGSEEYYPVDAIHKLTADKPNGINSAMMDSTLLIWY